MARELSEKEQNEYNKMIQGAKQLNLFGKEEELDARDFIIDRSCETEDEM